MDLCECGKNCKRKKCRLKKKEAKRIGKRLDGLQRGQMDKQHKKWKINSLERRQNFCSKILKKLKYRKIRKMDKLQNDGETVTKKN